MKGCTKMSNTTPSGLERLLFVCAVAATIHGTARADDAWTERLPLQDTYVDSAAARQNSAYGTSEGIIIGNVTLVSNCPLVAPSIFAAS